MERGGVGVGGGFPFTFWLAHFNVLALPSPVFAQRPPTPGSFQLWVGTIPQLPHIVHLVIALSTAVGLGNRNLSGARPEAIGLVFG